MPAPRLPGSQGRSIPSVTRKFVIARDGAFCLYCGDESEGIDHVVPWSQGGSHHPMNLVVCCPVCNSIAGDRVFTDIVDRIQYVKMRREQLGQEGIARVMSLGRDDGHTGDDDGY